MENQTNNVKEYTRIGVFGKDNEMEVYVKTDDNIETPHFHVKNLTNEHDVTITIETGKYCSENCKDSEQDLTYEQASLLSEFMRLPNNQHENNYETTIKAWNYNVDNKYNTIEQVTSVTYDDITDSVSKSKIFSNTLLIPSYELSLCKSVEVLQNLLPNGTTNEYPGYTAYLNDIAKMEEQLKERESHSIKNLKKNDKVYAVENLFGRYEIKELTVDDVIHKEVNLEENEKVIPALSKTTFTYLTLYRTGQYYQYKTTNADVRHFTINEVSPERHLECFTIEDEAYSFIMDKLNEEYKAITQDMYIREQRKKEIEKQLKMFSSFSK